jgi:hypothetical protein
MCEYHHTGRPVFTPWCRQQRRADAPGVNQVNQKEKAMTIRANLRTSMRLTALLVAAAIVIATPYGIALAVRSGICTIAQKVERTAAAAGVHALRRLNA